MKGVTAFVFLGSLTRALVDSGSLPYSFFTVSPGIYITIAIYLLASLVITHFLKKEKFLFYFGIIPSIALLPFIIINNIEGMLMIVCLALIFTTPFYLFKKEIKFDRLMFFGLSAHILDACSTWVSIDYFGYIEKHVLPTILINLSNTAFVMVLLKFAVIIPTLYIIDKYAEDKRLGNLLKIAIFILGLAPGLRNTIRLGMFI